jgi:hypothetical protein
MLLVIAAVLAAVWMISLLVLAHYTANPVMLNREQILESPYVVTGTVSDPAGGKIAVEREWKKQALSGTITVPNLSTLGAKTGVTYIIPLEKPDESLHVTEVPNSNGTPLIYPATPAALEQLKSIIDYQARLRGKL